MQLDTLERCLHYRALREALDSLPRDLHDTYARILDNLDNSKKPWTVRILQFLAYSERPLTLDEMVDALAVVPDAEEQDLSRIRMPFPDEIAGYASTLVTLVVRETEKGTVKEFHFAHVSVKEYLTSGKARDTLFQEAHAKADMTNVCLSYLLHLKKPMPVKDLRRAFPFAQFCARYWMEFAAVAEKRDETAEKIRKLATKFLTCKEGSFTNCYRLYNPDNPQTVRPNDDQMKPAHALYYTSLGGLSHSTKALLDAGSNVNEQGGRYGNALQAASYNGHGVIVEQLLDRGADINARGGDLDNALSAASSRGYVKVVKLLLHHGADVNARGENLGTALCAASSRGHEKIVTLLLDRGADVNAGDGVFGSALQAASIGSHKEVIVSLLDRGADVNLRKQKLPPLSLAARRGDGDIVGLLIAQGADVHFCNRVEGNALYVASEKGHASVVEILLRHKVDPNLSGNLYNSALQAALCEGHAQVAILLLKWGFKLDGKEDRDGRSIQSAITRAYAEAVQMFAENITNPDDGGPHPREGILNAVRVGFQTISDLLDKAEDLRNSWREKNENVRNTLITCVDGSIGM